MDYSTHSTYDMRSVVIALMMVIIGVFAFDFHYDTSAIGDLSYYLFLSAGVVLVIFGLAVFHPRFRSVMPTLGLMCIGIGLSHFLTGLGNIFGGYSHLGALEPFSVVIRVMSIETLVFSMYLIYRGFNFIRNDAMNAFVLRFTTMGLAIGYTLVVIYAVTFIPGVDLWTFWDTRRDFVVTPILYLMYFTLLCSKEVFDQIYMVKIRKSVSRVAQRVNPDQLVATHADYSEFRSRYPDLSKWDSVPVGSPVERSLQLNLRSEWSGAVLLLEKWKRSDEVHYTLTPADDSGFVTAPHGRLERIVFRRGELVVIDSGFEAIRIDVADYSISDENEDSILDEAVSE